MRFHVYGFYRYHPFSLGFKIRNSLMWVKKQAKGNSLTYFNLNSCLLLLIRFHTHFKTKCIELYFFKSPHAVEFLSSYGHRYHLGEFWRLMIFVSDSRVWIYCLTSNPRLHIDSILRFPHSKAKILYHWWSLNN